MKNVTVTLPEDLALWLRVHAAKQNRSVSSWLGEQVAKLKQQEDDYEVAMERFLAREPQELKRAGTRYPARETLHDRASLR